MRGKAPSNQCSATCICLLISVRRGSHNLKDISESVACTHRRACLSCRPAINPTHRCQCNEAHRDNKNEGCSPVPRKGQWQ